MRDLAHSSAGIHPLPEGLPESVRINRQITSLAIIIAITAPVMTSNRARRDARSRRMPSITIPPVNGGRSFSCPRCVAENTT